MRNWQQERDQRLVSARNSRHLAITSETSDLVATLDVDMFLLDINHAGLSLLGITPGENYGKHRLHGFFDNDYRNLLNNTFIPHAIEYGSWHSEVVICTLSNRKIPCSQVLIAHKDEADNISFFSLVLRDISKLKDNEQSHLVHIQRQLQKQKMETIGRLAGGIAHDFNNFLTIIMGYAELGLMNTSGDSQTQEELGLIIDSAEKASNLCGQLLDFGSKRIINPEPFRVNEAIQSFMPLLHSLFNGSAVKLNLELQDNLWEAIMDPTQFEQVLLNLVANAKDAISGNGEIKVKTQNIAPDNTLLIDCDVEEKEEFVLLCVEDTGCGLKEEVLAQIFEPFFTTKPKGKGTGLGLATVYGAIKQNKGHIHAESEVGKGTKFSILIPTNKDIEEQY